MSGFRQYDHVERWGHDEVEGIEIGQVYVFPKLDGTNASVWHAHAGGIGSYLQAGSRNRVLSHVQDNHGFLAWIDEQPSVLSFLADRPSWILYGEWLVPHTLKTYREDAWRRFWTFDVFDRETGRYLPWDDWAAAVRESGLDVVEPLAIYDGPSEEQIRRLVESNTYLIRDGMGVGEGVVVKNFAWVNRYGRQPWAKIVRNEFKEDNRRLFGLKTAQGERQVEAEIAAKYITPALVEKTRAKIEAETTNRRALIPRLLQTVFYELVREEAWSFIKEHRDPTIDFKKLRRHTEHATKRYAQDLFA
jgi:hypothetical protein